jgi:hypothetical protein
LSPVHTAVDRFSRHVADGCPCGLSSGLHRLLPANWREPGFHRHAVHGLQPDSHRPLLSWFTKPARACSVTRPSPSTTMVVEHWTGSVLLRDLCPRGPVTDPSVLASTPVRLARANGSIRAGASGRSPTRCRDLMVRCDIT